MFTADEVYDMARTGGHQVTLRRPGDSPPAELLVYAIVLRQADELTPGGMAQFRRTVCISNAEIRDAGWPGPPARGDQIVDNGRTMTVQAVTTHRPGGVAAKHDLDVTGR